MKKLLFIAAASCLVTLESAEIPRPKFWSTGVDENGWPQPPFAEELHWKTVGASTQEGRPSTSPWVWQLRTGDDRWVDPPFSAQFNRWICRFPNQTDITTTSYSIPYTLTVNLKNNFYTDFSVNYQAAADNAAQLRLNGLVHSFLDGHPTWNQQYKAFDSGLFSAGWNEAVNTIAVNVLNSEGPQFNPSGICVYLTQPTLRPRPDILWRDTVRGVNHVWYCDSVNYIDSGYLPTESDLSWKIVGAGVFSPWISGNHLDTLWHKQTGELKIWQNTPAMEGQNITVSSYPIVGTLPYSTVCGVGDFNSDQMGDILVRSGNLVAYYAVTFSGGQYTRSSDATVIGTETDPNWTIAGVGPFRPTHNMRSKRDIVWRNTVTGANRIWIVDAGAVTSVNLEPKTTAGGWNMRAFTKLDEDDVCDIIWFKPNGEGEIWIMNSDYSVRSYYPSTLNHGYPTVIQYPGYAVWDMVGPK